MQQVEFERIFGKEVSNEEFLRAEAIYMTDLRISKGEFVAWYGRSVYQEVDAELVKNIGEALIAKRVQEIAEAKWRKEMGIFIAEQAEVYSSAEMREKAIEIMGERTYIAWKIDNDKSLWDLDLELIKELI